MPAKVAIGLQDFEQIRERDVFYVDKTRFIREWWESGDGVTIITRPRRFGKTLMMNTVDRFLSNQYEDQGKLFEGTYIWQDESFRRLQGTVPVIFLSFADVKTGDPDSAAGMMGRSISSLISRYDMLRKDNILSQEDKDRITHYVRDMDMDIFADSLKMLSESLCKYYGKKVVILLDEYDTPMQEAYVAGGWDQMAELLRRFFNSTFKTNPYLDRALLAGITTVSRESMFSDLNNLNIVSVTSDKYSDAFGFTEEEVFKAMDTYGYADKEGVRRWYDGFIFGSTHNIYNPWSIINYLSEGKLAPYWSNTSSNALASKLIREGDKGLKRDFETLITGGSILSPVDEQIVFGEMQDKPEAIWSLLLAAGYLKITGSKGRDFKLNLTNHEVQESFEVMVDRWFGKAGGNYNDFIKALLNGDLEEMNYYMNEVALSTFSVFDAGGSSSMLGPEKFYHGFVLGLIVQLKDRYRITSNRESGLGRYDVQLMPIDKERDDGILMEFKVHNPKNEKDIKETVNNALVQIEEKDYSREMTAGGIPEDRIRKYGFAFKGKEVLIGSPEY